MIIYIDRTVIELDLSDPSIVRVFESILRAHHYGNHYVVADKITSILLNDSLSGLGDIWRSTLRQLSENYSFVGSFIESAKRKIIVCGSGVFERRNGEFVVPLPELIGVNLSQTHIVGEDLVDVRAMRAAAKNYAHLYYPKSRYRIDCRDVNGGGSRTFNTFASELKNVFNPVFCLTDTDSIRPGGAKSSYGNKCNKIALKSKRVCEHMYVDGREIENIIPIELLAQVKKIDGEKVSEIKLFFEKNVDGYRHFDVKKGLRKCWLSKHAGCADFRRFWSHVLSVDDAGFDALVKCSDPACVGKDECRCVLIDGLGDHTLEHLCDELESESISVSKRDFSNDLGRKWLELGEIVLAWTFAAVPSRT